MSALHEELAGGQKTTCILCNYLASLSLADAAEWNKELAEPVSVIGHTAIVNALKRRGVGLTEVSVRRHRTRHVAV
jgi:hypothetical protein